jgi:hypothetical protein
LKRAAALACAAVLACAQTPPPSEEPVAPPYPRNTDLIEFQVSPPGDFRFFVDGATLNVSKDGIVRYVVVARSAAGAENVSYEALRCSTAEYRIHAVGQPGERWGGRATPWRAVSAPPVQHWRIALQREYFCPQREPIRDAAEGRRALRDGGHPFSKGFGS